MSKEETFLLVDLKDEKSKEIAQTISNQTSRQILEYLSEFEEATESKLAKKLNIPISTVHYNLKQLHKANLITAAHFVWSDKGKKMPIYTLAKKLIIIAPKTTHGFKEKLKKIVPTALFAFASAAFVYYFSNQAPATQKSSDMLMKAMETSSDDYAAEAMQTAPSFLDKILQLNWEPTLYFLAGMLTISIIYFFVKKIFKN